MRLFFICLFLFSSSDGFCEATRGREFSLSFLEQRNIIVQEAVTLRTDWFKHVRARLVSGDNLTNEILREPELFRFYVLYLQANYQVSVDELRALAQVLKDGPNELATLRANYYRSDQLDMLYGERKPDPLSPVVSARERERRLLEQARKRLANAAADFDGAEAAEAEALSLIMQARVHLGEFPEALRAIFARPLGAPIVDRFGGSVVSAVEGAGLFGRLRARCAALLR